MSSGPDAAYAAALSSLPGMGPATLVAILRERPPREAWTAVREGDLGPDLPLATRPAEAAWQQAAWRLDPEAWWEGWAQAGIEVTWPGDERFPVALRHDPHPPGVLFWRGEIAHLDRPCVAIVGTRSATPEGRAVAFELGHDLACAGVCVVSGLALGIDGAAHTGVLAAGDNDGRAGPVGVAASGVNVPYPRQHARLWERVVEAGAVVSENLPGRPAQAWRFPSRNRVIAGLVQMVVVVESHAAGGSLITAEAALERGIDVRVVPGPVHSPASSGSNQLLYDGPGPVRDAQDVLDAIGLIRSGSRVDSDGAARHPRDAEAGLDAEARSVFDAVGWRPAPLSHVAERSRLGLGAVARILSELEGRGLVTAERGWWCRSRSSR